MTDYTTPRFAAGGHIILKSERHTRACPFCQQKADFRGYAHNFATQAYTCRSCRKSCYVWLAPTVTTDEDGRVIETRKGEI